MLPIISAVLTTIMGIVVSVFTAFISHRLKTWDQENTRYRRERQEKERKLAEEQRIRNEANDQLTLGMARTMLLDNYEKCVTKGYYSVAEREVYHKLYEAYRHDKGNGVIEELAEKIVDLPTEPPKGEQE